MKGKIIPEIPMSIKRKESYDIQRPINLKLYNFFPKRLRILTKYPFDSLLNMATRESMLLRVRERTSYVKHK